MKKNRGRDLFEKYRRYIFAMVFILSVFPVEFRKKIFKTSRNFRGNIGLGLRYILVKSLAISCGDNVSIHEDVILLEPQNLKIGNNVSIHPFSYIDCTGNIEIGNDVSIAHGVTILSTSHTFENINIPIKDQKIVLNKTIIEDDVWIGAKATILSGIKIKTKSIVGAGSVVTKDIDNSIIVGGVPARFIKNRLLS